MKMIQRPRSLTTQDHSIVTNVNIQRIGQNGKPLFFGHTQLCLHFHQWEGTELVESMQDASDVAEAMIADSGFYNSLSPSW
jgi:hypothetical protein